MMFDLCQPLPPPGSVTVLEASAGTGKTFTLSFMMARFIVEGIDIREIAAVTFSRMATQELRTEIRKRITEFDEALRDPEAQVASQIRDVIGTLDESTRAQAGERISRALSQMDQAPILTLHTFADRMLNDLGLLADHDHGAQLIADHSSVGEALTGDACLHVLQHYPDSLHHLGDLDKAWKAVDDLRQAALNHAREPINPPDAVPSSDIVRLVRERWESHKREHRLMDYSDMVGRLVDALRDPDYGPYAVQVLRSRFQVVMVDEFQDTDMDQWEILERTFVGHTRLVLIGDPKQAIYRFRGGDIETYSNAVHSPGVQTYYLGTNFRSDKAVVDGVQALLSQLSLGSPEQGITLKPLESFHKQPRLVLPEFGDKRVVVRTLDADEVPPETAPMMIARDVVAYVEYLLAHGHFTDGRPVRHSDITIVVSTAAFGRQVMGELKAAGHPAVTNRDISIYATPAAKDLLSVLHALATPRSWQIRRASTIRLLGGETFGRLDAETSVTTDLQAPLGQGAQPRKGQSGASVTPLLNEHLDRCATWLATASDIAERLGVGAAMEYLMAQAQSPAMVLGTESGAEYLGDIRHLTGICARYQAENGVDTEAVATYLDTQIRESADSVESARRVATDRPSIQIMTIHQSKGLQFPIVLVPEAPLRGIWNQRTDRPHIRHVKGERVLKVAAWESGEGTWEDLDEVTHDAHRTLYVAMTRAQSLVTVWWANVERRTAFTSIHHALSLTPLPSRGTLRTFKEVAYMTAAVTAPRGYPESNEPATIVEPSRFTDVIDRTWTRTSYSGLTQDLHHAPPVPIGSEERASDEPDLSEDVSLTGADTERVSLASDSSPETPTTSADGTPATQTRGLSTPGLTPPSGSATDASESHSLSGTPVTEFHSAFGSQVGGTSFGSLVHEVLEILDPAQADQPGVILDICTEALERYPLEIDAPTLAHGIHQIVTTPLGPICDGLTLADLGKVNLLAELEFELPMGPLPSRAGGTASGESSADSLPSLGCVGDLADLFTRHLPPSDPLADYGTRLRDTSAAATRLHGFLTGSIDVVMRVGERFVVADYKTNRVPLPPDVELSPAHYTPSTMAEMMMAAHYPLQALLYGAALHRYLSGRLSDYDPVRHLGGVEYLFVRGMIGQSTPVIDGMPAGVFMWRPPAEMIVEASGILGGGDGAH